MDHSFIKDCQANHQHISYCNVNAHLQSGGTEKKIRDLQEQTRTCLLYAMHKWPRMIITNLWPYALCYVNDVVNATLKKGENITLLEAFTSVSVVPKIRHFHSFGCPTYFWIIACNLDKGLTSGPQDLKSESILVHYQVMPY